MESSSELQKRFTDKMKKGINVKKISKDRPQFECKITLNEDETTISFEGGDSAVDPECASVVRSTGAPVCSICPVARLACM